MKQNTADKKNMLNLRVLIKKCLRPNKFPVSMHSMVISVKNVKNVCLYIFRKFQKKTHATVTGIYFYSSLYVLLSCSKKKKIFFNHKHTLILLKEGREGGSKEGGGRYGARGKERRRREEKRDEERKRREEERSRKNQLTTNQPTVVTWQSGFSQAQKTTLLKELHNPASQEEADYV